MNFAERLKQLRKHLKMTQKEFSKTINVSMAYIAVVETKTEVRHPSYNLIMAILNKYPEVNANWLLMGMGPMLKEGKADFRLESFLNDTEMKELQIIKKLFPVEERNCIFTHIHNYFQIIANYLIKTGKISKEDVVEILI